jgi:hypothetical protein
MFLVKIIIQEAQLRCTTNSMRKLLTALFLCWYAGWLQGTCRAVELDEAQELIRTARMKSQVSRNVQRIIVKMADKMELWSEEKIVKSVEGWIRKEAFNVFSKEETTIGRDGFKERILSRLLEGTMFAVDKSIGEKPLVRPLVAPTKLYRIEGQSSFTLLGSWSRNVLVFVLNSSICVFDLNGQLKAKHDLPFDPDFIGAQYRTEVTSVQSKHLLPCPLKLLLAFSLHIYSF